MSHSLVAPFIVGVTSTPGAGKSTFLGIVEKRGFGTLNMDALTHELLNSPNQTYDKVLKRFGADLVDQPGGPINRFKLAAIVFQDAKAKSELEAIIHPAVREMARQRIQRCDQSIVFVEVPLLFEANLQGDYDETLALTVNPDVQMQRVLQRPNMTEEHARKRLASQLPQEKKAQLATRSIDNSGTMAEFEAAIDTYLQALVQRAAAAATTSSDRNLRFRRLLGEFGAIATQQALDQIGFVGTTRHKEACASVNLDVDTAQANGTAGPAVHQHRLRVDVHMSVQQKPGSGGAGCGCKCGCDNCRNGCACSNDGDCGCDCKPTPVPPTPVPPTPVPPTPVPPTPVPPTPVPPTPVPPTPVPPTPVPPTPVPPTPDPPVPPCEPPEEKSRVKLWLIVALIFFLLAGIGGCLFGGSRAVVAPIYTPGGYSAPPPAPPCEHCTPANPPIRQPMPFPDNR